VQVWPR